MSSNQLSVYYDETFLAHEPLDSTFETPAGKALAVEKRHPDRRERIENVVALVEYALDDVTEWRTVEPADREQLERVHDPAYLDELKRLCEQGPQRITPTTSVSERTYEASTYAAGAAIQVAEQAMQSDAPLPYGAVRPSGHHAQPGQADGFCYVNNVSVAAEHLIETGQAERVAIVDWDVHPGNGTQEAFYDRDDVLFVNLHNDFRLVGPNHPQDCDLTECGSGDGEGYTINVPLAPGTGDGGYEYAFETIVAPVVEAYGPDLLLISAGQDGGELDPTGRNLLTMSGFRTLGAYARQLADDHAAGNLGLVQEGGYQIDHLAFATLGVLEGALDHETDVDYPWGMYEEFEDASRSWIDRAVETHAEYWPLPA